MFLYFLPGVKPQSFNAKVDLERFGLSYIMDPGETLLVRGVVSGVDSQPGVVIGHPRNFDHMGVKFSHDWTWDPCPTVNENQAYVGYKTIPDPTDLLRVKTLPGGNLVDDRATAGLSQSPTKCDRRGTRFI